MNRIRKRPTVNPRSVLLDQPNDALSTAGLGACKLNVVVVVEELGIRVGRSCSAEGNRDESLADDAVEWALGATVAAILLERLVDHVPVLAFALPVGHGVLDVGVHDGDHGLVIVTIANYPSSCQPH